MFKQFKNPLLPPPPPRGGGGGGGTRPNLVDMRVHENVE